MTVAALGLDVLETQCPESGCPSPSRGPPCACSGDLPDNGSFWLICVAVGISAGSPSSGESPVCRSLSPSLKNLARCAADFFGLQRVQPEGGDALEIVEHLPGRVHCSSSSVKIGKSRSVGASSILQQPAPHPAHGGLAARLREAVLVVVLEQGDPFAVAELAVDQARLAEGRPRALDVEEVLRARCTSASAAGRAWSGNRRAPCRRRPGR